MNIQYIIYTILLLPFLGAILVFFIKNKSLYNKILLVLSFFTLFFVLLICYEIFFFKKFYFIPIYNFITINNSYIKLSFYIDYISCIWLLMINTISLLVIIYSTGYALKAKFYKKFYIYINLFIFFMQLMILVDSYILMFIGWEGVGLMSYLLIGLYINNKDQKLLVNKIFILNKIGDIALLISILILININIISYKDLLEINISLISHYVLYVILTCITVASLIKSAQFPFHIWLPNAMIGPTPVSALIHSSTMVTAGIYLLIRSYKLYMYMPIFMTIITFLSIITILLSSLMALFNNNIKKILAYSTIGHLGYMFISFSINNLNGCLFHMITHSIFKALLFLTVGNLIMKTNTQNIYKYCYIPNKYIFKEKIAIIIGICNIIGIPPLGGFFSKENIISHVIHQNIYIGILILISIVLTSMYSYKMIYYIFFYKRNNFLVISNKLHIVVYISIYILIAMSLGISIINFLPIILYGYKYTCIEYISNFYNILDHSLMISHFNIFLIISIMILELIGICIYYLYTVFYQKIKYNFDKKYIFVAIKNQFYIDKLYDIALYAIVNNLYFIFNKYIEKNVNNIYIFCDNKINILNNFFNCIQSKYIKNHIANVIIGTTGIILLYLFNS
ncbi:MAG: hypothetical protein IR527_01715 [Bacteroides sp.]|nr:MAG: hypothetical protein IR527_01715 [Bacteroides sp.]